MRIVNTTGRAEDTKIFDGSGNDITDKLKITDIVINVTGGVRATITCYPDSVDVLASEVHAVDVTQQEQG